MLAQQYGFLIFTSLLNTIFAAPTPSADSTTTVPNLSTITHLGPISFPFPLDFTVLSFNYYEDPNCKTLLGSTNVSSIDLAAKTCFALPGNSLVFTYQLHQGTLSVYNPKEVNMHSYEAKDCYKPPTGPTGEGYMGGYGGCFGTSSIASYQAAWGEG